MNRYIFPILLVILSAAVYVSVIDATLTDIHNQQIKEVELENFLKDAKDVNEKLAAIKKTYAAFPAGSEQSLSTILPDKIDEIKFIIELESLARLHGLVLKGAHAGPSDTNTKGTSYKENKITFSVSAPYTVFHSFLKDVQDSLALREMTDISFGVDASSGESLRYSKPESIIYNYNVSLTSYSLGQ